MTRFSIPVRDTTAATAAINDWIADEARRQAALREAEVIAVLYVASFITGVPVATIIADRRAEVGW